MSADDAGGSEPDSGASPHVISATNFLIGATNFLILPLPEGCRLAPGLGAPDIESNVEHAGCYWVTDGRAHYLLYDPPRRLCLELAIRVTRRRASESAPDLAEGAFSVADHAATYGFGRRTTGLFRRQTLLTLAVSVPCEQTRRTIKLEIAGRCERSVLEDYLALLPGLRCH